ncbi:MAG: hypothetical protein DIU71_03665 [Proteobacteria bacterium]|nr:MAG: hypothetical protein DIU71_03665 [Pseudomonadota bacterium]
MLYSVLIYASEAVAAARSRQDDEALLARHLALQRELAAEGRLGAVVRLMPTTTATTVRGTNQSMVIDGPFIETKEQLLGLYLVECATLEEAIETARRIGQCCRTPDSGALEIRPVSWSRLDVPRGEAP